MTTHDSPDDSDLITQVVDAFERMRVPSGPSAQQTIELIELTASKDDARAVAPYSRQKPPMRAWNMLAPRLRRLTVKQRIVAGGVGLSTLAGLTLLLVALNSPGQLSAMERMAQQLREVKSYSYQRSGIVTWQPDDGKPLTTWTETGPTYWREPSAFRGEVKIIKTEVATTERPRTEQVVEHFAEIFPAGKLGIFIDYTTKTYRLQPYVPTGSATYPLEALRVIRENSGEVTRELGTKEIRGKKSSGYVLTPKNSHEKQPLHPLEVWVDPQTDLPIEFGFTVKETSRSTVWKATDFRWNTDLDPKLFEPTPPAGFADITPPDGQKELTEIAAALKLYAQLSGGHYPRVRRFDGRVVRDEMLKLAGFDGEPKPEWDKDPKYQSIQQATAGLDWIGRIIRNRYHASYDGKKVGPADKDKLLMWWRVSSPERYCLIYGDLRTEIIPQADDARLGLDEAYPDMTKDEPDAEQPPNEKQ
jgi:outer membrane lipoprotein-sorting protein